MREGAKYLIGEHDFVSFCNIRTNVEDTVRTVTDLTITKNGEDITIRITGNGFLYNMVRIIAGTLIRVGRGFYTPDKVKAILEEKERTAAGVTAPANGLVLVEVSMERKIYFDNGSTSWPKPGCCGGNVRALNQRGI